MHQICSPHCVCQGDLGNNIHFCQGGTPTIFLLGLESKRVSVLCPNFGRFSLIFLAQMLLKSIPGGPPEPFWASLGVGERKSAILSDFRAEKTPFWEAFGAPVRFCFSGLWDTKKGVQEGLQK